MGLTLPVRGTVPNDTVQLSHYGLEADHSTKVGQLLRSTRVRNPRGSTPGDFKATPWPPVPGIHPGDHRGAG
jgi:hypothetical protein